MGCKAPLHWPDAIWLCVPSLSGFFFPNPSFLCNLFSSLSTDNIINGAGQGLRIPAGEQELLGRTLCISMTASELLLGIYLLHLVPDKERQNIAAGGSEAALAALPKEHKRREILCPCPRSRLVCGRWPRDSAETRLCLPCSNWNVWELQPDLCWGVPPAQAAPGPAQPGPKHSKDGAGAASPGDLTPSLFPSPSHNGHSFNFI